MMMLSITAFVLLDYVASRATVAQRAAITLLGLVMTLIMMNALRKSRVPNLYFAPRTHNAKAYADEGMESSSSMGGAQSLQPQPRKCAETDRTPARIEKNRV